MKKLVVGSLIMLMAFSTYSVVQGDGIEDEVTITVTAAKKTTFDMFHNRVVKAGLTTPYEMKFDLTDSRFIFKTLKSKSDLKIVVKHNSKTVVIAEWPVAVLLITSESYTAFGMQ